MDITEKTVLQKHLETFNIYDLQRLLKCFQYELGLPNADKESINEIIESIQNAIAKVS